MSEVKSYTGVVQEISQTGQSDRAPRKVLINDGGEFSKTFRVWPFKDKDSQEFSPEMAALQEALHEEVTVYFQEVPKSGDKGSWTENQIKSVNEAPKGGAYVANGSGGKHGGGGLTEEKVRWIVRDELAKANVYSTFEGTTEVPDYEDFLIAANFAGFNEAGVEKQWAKHHGEDKPWCSATQEELEAFAKKMEFKWPSPVQKVAEKVSEGAGGF